MALQSVYKLDETSLKLPILSSNGFTCGTFDLLHAGHILLLQYAKSKCNHLIVGLQVDPSVDRPEKNKPIQSLYERQLQLEACRYVDQIIVYETERDLELLCGSLHLDIRFLGEEYKNKNFTGKQILLKRNPNFTFEYVDRSHGFSSSELRDRVSKAENNLIKLNEYDWRKHPNWLETDSLFINIPEVNLSNNDLSFKT